MTKRKTSHCEYHEHYYLYLMQVFNYDTSAFEVWYCAATDFVTAIELTEKNIQYSEMDADVCGCWEKQETLISQNTDERQITNE